jgi:hypothetical protein
MMVRLESVLAALRAAGIPPETIVSVMETVLATEREGGRRYERERKRNYRLTEEIGCERNFVPNLTGTTGTFGTTGTTGTKVSNADIMRGDNNSAQGLDRPSKSSEEESKEGVVESGCREGGAGAGGDRGSLLSPHTPLSSLPNQEDLLGSDINPLREENLTQSNLSEYTRARSKNHANSPRPPERRATRISLDWEPGEKGLAYAAQHGLVGEDLRDEIAKFKNYWESKGGRDAAKLDWAATWRNWVLNWKTVYGGKRHHHGAETRRRSAADDFFAGFDAAAAHLFGHSGGAWGASGEIPPGRINIDGRAAGGSHEDG